MTQPNGTKRLRILSLGAGVQSSTILLMAAKGEIERIDAAIFADTQWEPRWVYDHLAFLEDQARLASIPLYRVTAGSLRADALDNVTASWMPLYSRDAAGNKELLKRQCTRNYKIRPLRRKVRELCGGQPVEQVIGISWDEWQRMRDSDVKYITNVYPLVDRRMTRQDCIAWLERNHYPVPRKSSCIACPMRTGAEWREIRDDADSWQDAVDFDNRIRLVRLRTRHQEVFVHREAVPLVQVDLRSEQDRGQLDMFDGCGVLCATEDA